MEAGNVVARLERDAAKLSDAERLAALESEMREACAAVTELANLGEVVTLLAVENRRKLERGAWLTRALALVLVLVLARLLTACGGAPFESSSRDGSPLAGAQSSAGAQAAGASAGPSGGAGGVASGNEAGNAAGAGGEPVDVAGAGAVDAGGAPAIHLPCDTRAWKASAFASRAAELPGLALDGDAESRWTSGEARESGQWFALELGAGVELEQLEISAPAYPGDVPSSLRLELDGESVAADVTSPTPGRLVLTFAPTWASSARLVLTTPALTWWSIAAVGGICQ